MAHEVETSVLDIDANAIVRRLEELGARQTQKTRLVVDWYHVQGTKEGEDPWYLRIRSYSDGRHEVTWKAKSDAAGIARRHKEINFDIKDPAALAELFSGLGLERYAHQEKDRVSFALKNWSFDLDQYPNMPAYLEIEGSDEANIMEAVQLLDLGRNRTWNKGERTLIQQIYGLDWYDMRF